jgi:4-amino-4-deoxy-L-arabinose transferase-like glycosyltransferase
VFRFFKPEFYGLLLLTAALNLINLGQNGWANNYYSATVKSMTQSWHNFIFNSFDPAGVMTVDKPPLAMWVQAASAKVLGMNSWGILVPQAIMGIASVALLYDLTRRIWGRWPAFVAGAALALTPMTVAISRHNNPDALLVLCCVFATWCIVRALDDGRTRWLILSGLALGLGFETKMGAALLVLPALEAAYLYIAPRGYLRSFSQLLAGGFTAAAVGLAWPVFMWLTPAASRPWISGTTDNSIWSLIMNYNGLGRLDGQSGGPGGGTAGPGGSAGGGGFFGGSTGPFRLFNEALGGQAGWLLAFAAVSGVAVIAATRLRRSDARTGWLIAIGGCFLTIGIAFSNAKGIFHPYYTAQMVPFTAALVGGGFGVMQSHKISMRWFAAAALGIGVIGELVILSRYSGTLAWLPVPLILIGVGAGAAMLIVEDAKLRRTALAVGISALMLAPAIWSVQTLGYSTSSTFPSGGPQSAASSMGGPGGARGAPGARTGGPPGINQSTTTQGNAQAGAPQGMGTPPSASGSTTGGMFGGQDLTAITTYVNANGGGTIGVSSQSGASSAIMNGASVAGIGGFSGRESEVSAGWLANRVASGDLRWVYTGGSMGGPQDNRVGSSGIMATVAKVCTAVPASALGTNSTSSTASTTTSSTSSTLYDCSGKAAVLKAAI